MRHFDRDALPTAAAFYLSEFGSALGHSRQNAKGYVSVRCCFHDSSNPKSRSLSLNMRDGHFTCWSCGQKGGDVLDFVMKRQGLDFKHAAMKLGAWRDAPTPDDIKQIEARQRERERKRAEEEAAREQDRKDRIEIRDGLHRAEREYKQACKDHDWDRMSTLFESIRKLGELYREASGVESL